MLELLDLTAGRDLRVVFGGPAIHALLEAIGAPGVEDVAVHDGVCTSGRGPVDGAVLELLEGTSIDGLLVTLREAESGLGAVKLLVLRADGAVDDGVGLVRVTGEDAVLEVLGVALADLAHSCGRVLEVARLVAARAPRGEHVARDGPSAGLRGPVDGAVLEVNEAALAVRSLLLAGGGEAQPGGRAADFRVAGVDAAEQRLCAGARGPVGRALGEVLGLALAVRHVVLVVDAGADDAALGGGSDIAHRGTVRAAVFLGQTQGVRDVREGLLHLELPVFPAVDAGRAELGGDRNAGLLRVVHEGLGGHAREHLEADARYIGRPLGHGPRGAEVVLAGAGRDVDGHVLERLDAQLRVVVDPILGVVRAPHVGGGVSARIHLRGLDGLRHALRGGVQVAGEGTDELEEVRATLGQVHGGGAAHGDADDAALFVGTELVLEDRREFLGEEGLPHVVLAVVRLLPVRVEGGLAADGHDDVDVLVRVEGLDVGLDGPAGLIVARTQAVERPDLREGLIRLGVPIACEQDLHTDFLLRHGGRLHPHLDVARGKVLDAVDGHTLRQALNLRMILRGDRGALRRVGRREGIREARTTVAGQAVRQRRLRVGARQQGYAHGDGGGQSGGSDAATECARRLGSTRGEARWCAHESPLKISEVAARSRVFPTTPGTRRGEEAPRRATFRRFPSSGLAARVLAKLSMSIVRSTLSKT